MRGEQPSQLNISGAAGSSTSLRFIFCTCYVAFGGRAL